MKKDLKDFVYVFEATAGELAMLVGPLDENLRQIETAFDAKISRRGNIFRIAGAEAPKASAVLQSCAARVHAGEEISVNDVQMAVLSEQTGSSIDDDEEFMLKTRRAGLQPRTPNQKKYLRAIMQTDVVYFLMEILWHVELRKNSLPEIIFIQQRQIEWLESIFLWRLPGRTLWNVLKRSVNNGRLEIKSGVLERILRFSDCE